MSSLSSYSRFPQAPRFPRPQFVSDQAAERQEAKRLAAQERADAERHQVAYRMDVALRALQGKLLRTRKTLLEGRVQNARDRFDALLAELRQLAAALRALVPSGDFQRTHISRKRIKAEIEALAQGELGLFIAAEDLCVRCSRLLRDRRFALVVELAALLERLAAAAASLYLDVELPAGPQVEGA